MAKIVLSSQASHNLKRLPKKIVSKIDLIILQLSQNPSLGRKLKGELKDKRRIRVGDYRIVYKFFKKENQIFIYNIEHRQHVYRSR